MAARKIRTAHETPALTRGNLERAAQLARRAAEGIEDILRSTVSADVDGSRIDGVTATLGDALTELGE